MGVLSEHGGFKLLKTCEPGGDWICERDDTRFRDRVDIILICRKGRGFWVRAYDMGI
jgi:hypothetical protein